MILERVVISEVGVGDESLLLLFDVRPCLFDLSTGELVGGPILGLMFASAIEEDSTSTAA